MSKQPTKFKKNRWIFKTNLPVSTDSGGKLESSSQLIKNEQAWA